jgi:hypothetical protein
MLWNEASASHPDRSGTMDSSTQRITPLRRRMIDDIRMRKLSDKTQSQYIRAVRRFAALLRRIPLIARNQRTVLRITNRLPRPEASPPTPFRVHSIPIARTRLWAV